MLAAMAERAPRHGRAGRVASWVARHVRGKRSSERRSVRPLAPGRLRGLGLEAAMEGVVGDSLHALFPN
jgi:hypothetical protein